MCSISVHLSICFPFWLLQCQYRGIQQYSASFHLRTAKLFAHVFGMFFFWFFFGPLILKALFSCFSFFSNDSCKVECRQAELRLFLLVVNFDVGCGVASCLATVQLASQALTNDIPFFSLMLYACLWCLDVLGQVMLPNPVPYTILGTTSNHPSAQAHACRAAWCSCHSGACAFATRFQHPPVNLKESITLERDNDQLIWSHLVCFFWVNVGVTS